MSLRTLTREARTAHAGCRVPLSAIADEQAKWAADLKKGPRFMNTPNIDHRTDDLTLRGYLNSLDDQTREDAEAEWQRRQQKGSGSPKLQEVSTAP